MIKKSKLYLAIDPCLRIFQLFFFADFSVSRNSSTRQKFSAFWILIKYLVMLGIMVYQIRNAVLRQLNSLKNSYNIPIVRIAYLLTSVEGIASLLQALAGSSKSVQFMKRMEKVDALLINTLSVKIDYEDLRWTLLISMTPLSGYFIGSFMVIYFAMSRDYNLARIAFDFQIPILLMRMYTQRYIFKVDLLNYYLKEVVKVLEAIVNNQPLLVRKQDINHWRWNTRKNHLKIRMLKKVYRLLWEASRLLNESYGLGLVYIFFVQFCILLYLGYSICYDLTLKDGTHRQLISLFMTLFGLIIIHYYCQQCLNSVTN